ncbi:glucose-1-phosphate thymidylyltransferase [Streptomyces sp. NBC_00893]|uniref:glucose-1-phosphate thymidylyltransferase n=1 Tax=Streptomyces sp. NBC_00893 TaxID=2975862 RepID=UPI00225109D3|nr:glucose-1-phosphate thymidylyltransferase [Streptomyces sp. NBC_00893]MCX4851924.1 glucose-1-phosphate thymidylyltransferase [Streptomyces sp. NBC_00893]
MKALVLSGGSGTRLRPFTYSMPKQLMPVANRPVLEHVLENIRELGVSEVAVVVGDREREIAAVLGDGARLGLRLTYIRQEQPLGLAHCVKIAREFLGEDDFVMYLGDSMLPQGVKEMAREFAEHRPTAQVVVQRVADPRAFGVAEVAPDGRVTRLVEKPEQPRSDLALTGVYFFTPVIHQAIDKIPPSARGELEITDALQWLVSYGATVRAREYTGYWKDTGRAEDVLDCNRELLRAVERSVGGLVDDSVLTGPVVVEPGARVVRSRIVGPAIVGAGSQVVDSHVGPYTSIGRGCRLRDTAVEDSIVLDGASVSRVPALRGSLIGRSAAVTSAEGGTVHHRLVVGDHTQVEVAA